MKKRIMATLLTTCLLVSLFSTTALADDPAWNSEGGVQSVEGLGTVVDPIYNVILPGDLTFTINPMYTNQFDLAGNTVSTQIISPDYTIENLSNVMVNVKMEIKATIGSNVVLKTGATADYDTKSKEIVHTNGKQNMVLAVLAPTGAPTVTADNVITLAFTDYDKTTAVDLTTAANLKGLVLTSSDQTINYVLNKFDETKAYNASENANIASGFKFTGMVDPNCVVGPEDVKVVAKFTLNGITALQKAGSWDTGKLTTDKNSGFDATVAIEKSGT